MLEAYSLNYTADADTNVSFENVSLQKGCTTTLSGDATIQLNKCGVYMVSVDATAEASTTLQLYKDGVAQNQAQSTGTTPSFVTLVQVSHNNCECACSSPVLLTVRNTTATTLTDINVCVTKIV